MNCLKGGNNYVLGLEDPVARERKRLRRNSKHKENRPTVEGKVRLKSEREWLGSEYIVGFKD